MESPLYSLPAPTTSNTSDEENDPPLIQRKATQGSSLATPPSSRAGDQNEQRIGEDALNAVPGATSISQTAASSEHRETDFRTVLARTFSRSIAGAVDYVLVHSKGVADHVSQVESLLRRMEKDHSDRYCQMDRDYSNKLLQMEQRHEAAFEKCRSEFLAMHDQNYNLRGRILELEKGTDQVVNLEKVIRTQSQIVDDLKSQLHQMRNTANASARENHKMTEEYQSSQREQKDVSTSYELRLTGLERSFQQSLSALETMKAVQQQQEQQAADKLLQMGIDVNGNFNQVTKYFHEIRADLETVKSRATVTTVPDRSQSAAAIFPLAGSKFTLSGSKSPDSYAQKAARPVVRLPPTTAVVAPMQTPQASPGPSASASCISEHLATTSPSRLKITSNESSGDALWWRKKESETQDHAATGPGGVVQGSKRAATDTMGGPAKRVALPQGGKQSCPTAPENGRSSSGTSRPSDTDASCRAPGRRPSSSGAPLSKFVGSTTGGSTTTPVATNQAINCGPDIASKPGQSGLPSGAARQEDRERDMNTNKGLSAPQATEASRAFVAAPRAPLPQRPTTTPKGNMTSTPKGAPLPPRPTTTPKGNTTSTPKGNTTSTPKHIANPDPRGSTGLTPRGIATTRGPSIQRGTTTPRRMSIQRGTSTPRGTVPRFTTTPRGAFSDGYFDSPAQRGTGRVDMGEFNGPFAASTNPRGRGRGGMVPTRGGSAHGGGLLRGRDGPVRGTLRRID